LLVAAIDRMDLRRFTPGRLFRRPTTPVSQLAPPAVLARFRYLEPRGVLVRSWPDDLDVSIVPLSGTVALVAGCARTVLERDDVVALGAQSHYELANSSSDERAWFVELRMRCEAGAAPTRPRLHHVTADRRRRVRTFVDLLPEPRLSSVILCAGDAVACALHPGRVAYVASTVGVIAVNDLQVGAVSTAILRGPGRVTIRALESSEVLLVSQPDFADVTQPRTNQATIVPS
jgi:hypothetical protein